MITIAAIIITHPRPSTPQKRDELKDPVAPRPYLWHPNIRTFNISQYPDNEGRAPEFQGFRGVNPRIKNGRSITLTMENASPARRGMITGQKQPIL